MEQTKSGIDSSREGLRVPRDVIVDLEEWND
jgi:hypothetical protein